MNRQDAKEDKYQGSEPAQRETLVMYPWRFWRFFPLVSETNGRIAGLVQCSSAAVAGM